MYQSSVGHMNLQNVCCLDVNYIIDHSFAYTCISQVLHILVYTLW